MKSQKSMHAPMITLLLVALLAGCQLPTPTNRPSAVKSTDPTGALTTTIALTTTTPVTNLAIPTAGLVGYWPFDLDFNDASGQGNHATGHNATLAPDRYDQPSAVVLDGNGGYIEVPPSKSLNVYKGMTISLWLYAEAQPTSTYYSLVEKSDPDRDGHARYGLWLRQGIVTVCVEPISHEFQRCLDAKQPLAEQQWHHIVGRYDGSALTLMIDDQPAGAQDFGRALIDRTDYELYFGADLQQSNVVYLTAKLDEIRLYDRALSDEEVHQLYASER